MAASRALRPVPDITTVSRVEDRPVEAFEELPSSMWALPSDISDSGLSALHATLIRGLRRDAAHLPTGTLQAMQLERIAYYYIFIRWHDMNETWTSSRDRVATYKLWRDLSADFCSIAYGNKISPETLHAMIATHTAKIIASVLRTLPNDQARPLYAKFASAIEAGPDVG